MSLALVIPSYRRPDALARCLDSVRAQSQPFDEVVVVVREDDPATRAVAAGGPGRVVTVREPGVLAAMRAGVAATTSDLVAFTDDDATLTPEWSARVRSLFARDDHGDVGGVGGRDVLYDGDLPRPTTLTARVGVITWWGRVLGNHHRGAGPGRDVAVLKGVNAAYRRRALGLPLDLRGRGAEAHFEVAVGRFAHEHGWRLRYYPDLTVRHYPATRADDDQRDAPSDEAVADSAYNLMRGLSPSRQSRRWLYVHLVGDRSCPGLARWTAAVVRGDDATRRRRAPSWRATTAAWRVRRDPVTYSTFS